MHDPSRQPKPRRVWRGLFGMAAFSAVTVGLVALAIAALGPPPSASTPLAAESPGGQNDGSDDRVQLAGGTFSMGKNHSCGADESPAHDVTLTPFRVDAHEVTNAQFADFVAATGYITEAEQQGWGLVFDNVRGDWKRTSRSDWRHPRGPESTIVGRQHHPVVQVSWHDAVAYAAWAGGRLPTEAEWEYVARSGLADADFPWGGAEQADGVYHANYHQGWFPETDTARDGHAGLSAVGRYAPASNGTLDMSGNAAEWCADRYAADYYAHSPHRDPTGPTEDTRNASQRHTVRGGSYLSPEGYCPAYRVTARDSAPAITRRDDLGFRCVYDVD